MELSGAGIDRIKKRLKKSKEKQQSHICPEKMNVYENNRNIGYLKKVKNDSMQAGKYELRNNTKFVFFTSYEVYLRLVKNNWTIDKIDEDLKIDILGMREEYLIKTQEINNLLKEKKQKPLPFINPHPGEHLKEVMEDNNLDPAGLQFYMWQEISEDDFDSKEIISEYLSLVLGGKLLPVGTVIDKYLAKYLKTPEGYWSTLSKNYLETEARKKEAERQEVEFLTSHIESLNHAGLQDYKTIQAAEEHLLEAYSENAKLRDEIIKLKLETDEMKLQARLKAENLMARVEGYRDYYTEEAVDGILNDIEEHFPEVKE